MMRRESISKERRCAWKVAILTVATAFLVLSASWAAAGDKAVVVIGHLPHFTGAYAATQAHYAPAQDDAVEWINRVNYIPGVELKLIWADGGTNPAKSLAGFKKMIAHKPKPVVIIGESTGIGTSLVKWHAKARVPDIEGGMSQAMIDPPSWTFCQPPPYASQFGAWVDYYLKYIWKKKTPPKFAWLTWDNPFGRSPMTKEAEAYLKSKGIQIVAREFIPNVPSNTASQSMRLRESGADFTFGGMYPSALSVVLKDMKKLGMLGSMTIGMSYATNLVELVNYVGNMADGVYITSIHPLVTEWEQKCPMVKEMYERNNRKANKWIYANCWSKFAIAAEVVKRAVQAVGPENVDGQAAYNALVGLRNFDAWGISPPISFSQTRRVGMDSVIIQTVENGQVVSKGFMATPDLLPGGKDVPR
ncbi:MAG: ABC transporter substrate-binding protein [Deltaproteobacteria bacterium]|nr:ABC transporter substrate-binding protein [Deltaproteobacteria bacterium]